MWIYCIIYLYIYIVILHSDVHVYVQCCMMWSDLILSDGMECDVMYVCVLVCRKTHAVWCRVMWCYVMLFNILYFACLCIDVHISSKALRGWRYCRRLGPELCIGKPIKTDDFQLWSQRWNGPRIYHFWPGHFWWPTEAHTKFSWAKSIKNSPPDVKVSLFVNLKRTSLFMARPFWFYGEIPLFLWRNVSSKAYILHPRFSHSSHHVCRSNPIQPPLLLGTLHWILYVS